MGIVVNEFESFTFFVIASGTWSQSKAFGLPCNYWRKCKIITHYLFVQKYQKRKTDKKLEKGRYQNFNTAHQGLTELSSPKQD